MENVMLAYPAPHLPAVINSYVGQTPFPLNLVLLLALNVAMYEHLDLEKCWAEEHVYDELLNYYENPANGMITESVLWELRAPDNPSGEKMYSQIIHAVDQSTAIVTELANHLGFIFNIPMGLNELAQKHTLLNSNLVNGILFMEFGSAP